MKKFTATPAPRKPRADAQRNRQRILEVAKAVFTRRGAEASLDEIAKLAEVGPGTLYRHFPTRDDLLVAVYRSEVERLGEVQRKFSAELPPAEALRQWLLVFIDYLQTKKLVGPALNAMVGGPSQVYEHSSNVLTETTTTLAANAIASGDLSKDVDPMDMLRAIYGVSTAAAGDDWPVKARRFVDVLISGSRP
nr:TetR/AcrR family transcriptional regulator [Terriglobus tenax]